MNTNNIITVNIHVFNRETNSKEIVKVSVKADNVMKLCEKLAGTVNGRNLHYLLDRPELFNKTRYFFSCFTKAFKNYLVCEKEIGLWHRFVYDGISLDNDKLKAYYKICVDSGYDEEAEKLRSEVDSRGLKLNESISLSTYAELF